MANPNFLLRVCEALDTDPRKLAEALGMRWRDFEHYVNVADGLLPDVDQDEVWWNLYELTSQRLAVLLALRAELDRKVQRVRVKKAKRFAAMIERGRRGRPSV